MNQLEALNITAAQLGFTITQEITTGHIYRECNNCHAYAEFSGLHTLDLSPCRCGGVPQAKTEQSGHNTPGAPETGPSAEMGAVVIERYCGFTRAHRWALDGIEITDREVLAIADKNGRTVAHLAAQKGQIFTDPDILRWRDKTGYTVAHYQTHKGYQFTDRDILALADKHGYTVAHRQACAGWVCDDPEILSWTDRNGFTVAGSVEYGRGPEWKRRAL